jgi:hydrogenase maturation protein HypF
LIVKDGDTFRVCFEPLVGSVAEDLMRGEDRATVSVQFHNTIAKVIEKVCELIGSEQGLDCVALSGGVFQNLYLMEKVEGGLQRLGFRVLTHHRVPCNDGGISLGQAVVARRAGRRQSGSHP